MKRRKSNRTYIARLGWEVKLLRKEIAGIETKLKKEMYVKLDVVLKESGDTILFLREEFAKLEREFKKRTRREGFLERLFNNIFKRGIKE